MRALIAVVLVLMCTACVTTKLTPAGQSVRVTSNPDAVKGCQLLGPVVGKDRMNGGTMGQGAAEENAHRRLQNAAAEMGADTVLLVTVDTGTSGSIQRGEAYRCR